MQNWAELFKQKIFALTSTSEKDPAHDFLHFQRVVSLAEKFCHQENGNWDVVMPAAWFHDFVIIPKNDPRRSQASRLSAREALIYLKSIHYPEIYMNEIAHAIEAHSFSAEIQPRTLEAKIVQDADRIDALGAIGIARCFATSALMKNSFYNPEDPFCKKREPQELDDKLYTVDHFYKKLFKIAETLQTNAGRNEAKARISTMNNFLSAFQQEIN